ncbi:hypothetical protein E2C01_030202 [Portunus trituberculatus]|uniref:Uncharacterized protein n=1 Tax=Portunus trituberculatus TaxID=210409 RepID=A0A5B7EV28_PORTR|nr:hypothetical protein [Portunus trituberculatus]
MTYCEGSYVSRLEEASEKSCQIPPLAPGPIRGNEFWRFTANMASTTTTGGTSGDKNNGDDGKDKSRRGKRVEKAGVTAFISCLITFIYCLLVCFVHVF